MSVIKKAVVGRTRVSLEQRVEENLLSGKSSTITFVMPDGSKTQQPINDKFIEGKKVKDIVDDICSIQNDLCAKYFTF